MRRAKRFRRALPWAAAAAALWAGGEAAVARWRLDARLLAPLLYYQGADVGVHQVSAAQELHYELAPGASLAAGGRRVGVNALGFRGGARSRAKPKGVFRIVCLGASNVYGAAVGDRETFPARLEAALNARGQGAFEVWNGGVCAYVLSQTAAQAAQVLAEYDPDLLILQVGNRGRRPFLLGQPFAAFFDRDPSLYRENLRHWWPPALDVLGRSGVCRAGMIALNRALGSARRPGPASGDMDADDAFNTSAFVRFAAAHPKAPLLFLLPPSLDLDARVRALGVRTLTLGDQLPEPHPKEYELMHPPAEVYRWYARAFLAAVSSQASPGAGGLRRALLTARDPRALVETARALAAAGRRREAAAALAPLAALSLSPALRRQLAGAYAEAGDARAALAQFESAPGASGAGDLIAKARLQARLGRRPAALASLAASLARDAGDDQRLEAALVYQDLGEPARALELLDGLTAAHPADARYLASRGVAEALAGREERAERTLREALRLDPGELRAALTLGYLCERAGREREAAGVYASALAHARPGAAEEPERRALEAALAPRRAPSRSQ